MEVQVRGKRMSVSDGLRSVNLAFDGDDLASFTDAGGNQTLYQYDPGGLMTGSQSPLGNVPLSQSWDAEGRVGSQSDSTGNTLTLTWTACGKLTFTTNPMAAGYTGATRTYDRLTALAGSSTASLTRIPKR